MRVALLISGYLRTFKINIPIIKEKIIEKFKNVDIYVHITKNESESDVYLNLQHEDDIKYINNILKPVCIISEENIKYSDDLKRNNLANIWIKYFKLNEIKKINESIHGKYDMVIKYRPDLNLISDDIFYGDINKDIVYIPKNSVVDKSKLLNKDDNYICDIFAYGNSNIMNRYFSIFNNIDELTNKHGCVPETIMYYHLKYNNIPYNLIDIDYNVILSMCNVFAICGDSGSGKTTLGNILKQYFSNSFMLECDRYHKWERNHDNWKKFTHLNPDANYITKMNNDIFDLKIGKDIYQVDYNHENGKFTESEKIEKSDNIIVCGLHSLHTNNDEVYNLKIFIDTDINLKTRWKMDRDTKKRGYTISEIISQMESRKEDYYKFIYPQREKSDIIINFHTDIDKEYNSENIYLNVYINKRYLLIDILSKLSESNIEFNLNSTNEVFNEISFNKYQKFEFIPNHSFENYYDYIMFIILSLHNINNQ